MNICFISPFTNTKDGIARYSREFVDALKSQDQFVTVLTMPDQHSDTKKDVFPTIRINPFSVISSIRVIKKKKIDVVHIQYAVPTWGLHSLTIILICIYLRFFTKVKIIFTFHEVNRELILLKALGVLYFNFLSTLSTKIFVHTAQAKLLLTTKCSIREEKVVILPHFIYAPPSHEEREVRQSGRKHIVFFGFIHVDKGIEYLIEAINELKNTQPDFYHTISVTIAGEVRPRKSIFKFFERNDMNYFSSLKALVLEYQLEDSIHFRGFIPEESIYSFLRSADVFILPYTNAEQSGVLHKVLPLQIPIVASNVSGIGETLKDVGVLVEPKNVSQLSSQIYALLTNSEYHNQISASYDKIVTSGNIDKLAMKTIQEYKSIVR